MSKISLLPLGGQDERNKNSFVVKVDNDVMVFNCGGKIPVNSLYGVNIIIPDYSSFLNEKDKIKGIFIGFPTFENHASLLSLLQIVGIKTPIYCTEIGKIIIETFLEKKYWGNSKNIKLNINVVYPLRPFMVGKSEITPFLISNSIPGSVGWVVKTNDGSIVLMDEFIINNDRSRIFNSQISKIDGITKHKTLALLTSLGSVGKNKNFTTPNHKNISFYQSVIKKSPGRVFVACNDSDIYTILNLAQIAKSLGRPFSIYSNTFMNVFSNIVKNKLINPRGLNCIQISEINNSPNAIVVISVTHEQLFKKLSLIVDNQINSMILNENDIFILGTQLVPGYEGHGAQLLDKLSKKNIVSYTLPKTILPMMASDEDQKYTLDKLNPKYVFPMQGLYKSFVKYEMSAAETWVKPEQIFFLDNGEEITIENGEIDPKKKTYKLVEKYISNNGIEEANNSILFERQKLSDSGVVFLTLFIDKESQKFINKINYQTYGIITKIESNDKMINEIMDNFKLQILNYVILDEKTGKINHKETKVMFKKIISKMFEKKFDKRPIVLTSIIEID